MLNLDYFLKKVKTPKLLKGLFGEYLLKREKEPERVMTFEVGAGMTEEQRKRAKAKIAGIEAPPTLSILIAPITSLIKRKFVEEPKEREIKLEEFKTKYPERYEELIHQMPMRLFSEIREEAIKKGAITEEEAELFSLATVEPAIAGTEKLGIKGAKIVGKERVAMMAKALKRKISKEIPKYKSLIGNLIKARYSEIKIGALDSEIFIKNIERNLTKAEREKIPFIREGTIKGTKKLQKWANKIGEYYDEGYEFLKNNYDDVNFIENYVNRVWDIPKNKTKQVVSYFTTKNPFLKKRVIPTLKEGMKLGLKPKTTDISELLRIYDSYKFTTVANKRFIDGIKMLTDDTGQKLIQRIDKAPTDWKIIDHPALRRAIGIKAGEGKLLLPKIPVKVNPEIAKEIEVVLGRPFSGEAVRALDTIYAFTKKAALSVSFFHHWALSESAISSGIKKKMFSLWNPYKIYRALRYKEYDIYKKIPLTKDALKHQLQLGAIPDVQRHRVHRILQELERITKNIPIVKKITKGIRGFNEYWDRALWDYYHNGLKLYTYEKWVQEELQRAIKKGSKESVDIIKDKVAQLVNDTFGGQVWENFLITPKARQGLHWLLLSPDWTLSTLRQAASPFAKGTRGRLGRKFWLRAAFYFWGGSNIINGVMSKKYLGEWRWMWENDPKHKTYIFIGLDENGQKKYMRFGKQYREIFEWFGDPIKKFGSKLAPITKEAYTQLSGYTPTGWKEEWAGKKVFDPEALEARAKSLIKMGVPYSVSTLTRSKNLLGLVMPISKGLSWYEARELMMDAIDRKDKDYLVEIWRAALENNLNAKKIFQSAQSEIKLGKKWEYKDVQKLINDLRKMGKEKGLEKFKEMKKSGEITPEIEKQIRNILLEELEIKKQREKVGI